MHTSSAAKIVRGTAKAATWIAILGAALFQAACQGTPPAASGGSSIQLQPYTAPDQSASAGVPSGWTVSKGEQTVIQMTGPKGETIFLGYAAIARNAPFQLGQRGTGGVDLSMPYTASLVQKLTMILQQGASLGGKSIPQVELTSGTPIHLPPAMGQCGRFVANTTSADGAMKIMGAICSFPIDTAGVYKNVMLLAIAPASVATEDAPIASAVFSSYRIPPAMLQRKLAPFTAPPPRIPMGGGGGGGMMPSIIGGQIGSDVSSTCFDLGVIRALPPRQLPQECGGEAPNP
jgi:hypothetical protein